MRGDDVLEHEPLLPRAEARRAVVLNGRTQPLLELRGPRRLRRHGHRIGERVAERRDIETFTHPAVPKALGIGLETETMQDSVAQRVRDVTHPHDVSVAPFVDDVHVARSRRP